MTSTTQILDTQTLMAHPQFCLPALRAHLDRPVVEGFPCVLGLFVNQVLEGVAIAELSRRLLPGPLNFMSMTSWQLDDYNRQANLIDFYVLPGRRRQELSGVLLKALEETLQKNGAVALNCEYVGETPQADFLKEILSGNDYEPPVLSSVKVFFTHESMRHAQWMRHNTLPQGIRIIPWKTLTETQRARLRAEQKENPWIPSRLDPFEAEKDCEPTTSLAALRDGEVVGWMITHRDTPENLKYTSAYLRPELARLGYLCLLSRAQFPLATSIGVVTGTFETTSVFDEMLQVSLKWFGPLSTKIEKKFTSLKRFVPLPPDYIMRPPAFRPVGANPPTVSTPPVQVRLSSTPISQQVVVPFAVSDRNPPGLISTAPQSVPVVSTTSSSVESLISEVFVLSESECDRAERGVMDLRQHWVARHPDAPFYTLGTASYLDGKIPPTSEYTTKAKASNPILKEKFDWLHDRVREALQSALNAPVDYPEEVALPGFHVFLSHPSFTQANAKIHIDNQYASVPWKEAHRLDYRSAMSFTLSIALPECGGGLFWWERSPVNSMPDLSFPPNYHLYKRGWMAMHQCNTWHQIAPAKKITPQDRRITLQGHALKRNDGRWQAYW